MSGFRIDRAGLEDAFGDLGRLAWEAGKTIEIAVYGGSALMLSYDWRLATRDVDAVFENDRTIVRRLADVVANRRGWPKDWLNDGVKGFLSTRDSCEGVKSLFGEFPSPDAPGLRVFVPRPEYMFAMKCRAMRLGGVGDNGDIDDIRNLALEIDVADAQEALTLVASFYPQALLPPKVRFGIEEIFGRITNGVPRRDAP